MCTRDTPGPRIRRQSGISLIELVMFIIIVSVGVAGILSVMDVTSRTSTDPLVRKQAVAIAEALMEEIQQQPFTYCDPDDPLVTTASGIGVNSGCSSANHVEGPTGAILMGEARGSATAPLDNVYDYSGFTMTGITAVDGTAVSGLDGYTATVTIVLEALTVADGAPDVPAAGSLRIEVRVTSGTVDVTLTGYRLRFAPNAAS
jgi:MSHA pilin protein MshD